MLDFAELVVLNKFDKRGAEDALRDVRKQWKRNRVAFQIKDEDVPVYPTIASQFNDPGISWMFANLCRLLRDKLSLPADEVDAGPRHHAEGAARHRADPRRPRALPGRDRRAGPRRSTRKIETQAEIADRAQSYWQSLQDLGDDKLPKALDLYAADASRTPRSRAMRRRRTARRGRSGATRRPHAADPAPALQRRHPVAAAEALKLLRDWPARLKSITDDVTEYEVRGKAIRVENYRESLSPPEDPEDRRAHLQVVGRAAGLPAEGKPAGLLPVHRRRVSVPPHRRGPDPHVRRRRHAGAHQPPLPLPQRRPAGRAPVDRVRQRHAVRRRPGRRARTSTARSATPASTSPRSTT